MSGLMSGLITGVLPLQLKGKLTYLLLSLMALLLLYPYLEGGGYASAALNFIFTCIMVFATYAVSFRPRTMWIVMLIGIPWLIISWVDVFSPIQNKLVLVCWYLLMSTFFVYVSAVIMAHILRSKVVTVHTISGAICVYIFIGLLFFILHGTVETVMPGSYTYGTLPPGVDHLNWSAMLYYSFITLTTLGYGDISPLTSPARSLAIVEAIIGIFYVAILIARLINASDWKIEDEATDGEAGWNRRE